MSDNREAVAEAMRALGLAYRGDWSEIDGRTLRSQLVDLASWLASDAEPVTYRTLCVAQWVCPENRCWPEHCPEARDNGCPHVEPLRDE